MKNSTVVNEGSIFCENDSTKEIECPIIHTKYPISETDDCWKKIIKETINRKGVNPERFSSIHSFKNMTSALTKDSGMCSSYFHKWCTILDISLDIRVVDI